MKLYGFMLDNFKVEWYSCVTINSAYMGDIMTLIGRQEWKVNMLGTVLENRTGADTEEEGTKENTYEAVMWKHDNEPL